jgi:hypothetical protein
MCGDLVNNGVAHVNMSRILLIKPRYGAQQGRLSAAAGAQERKKLSFGNLDVHIIQGNNAGKGFSDVFYVNTFSDHGPLLPE